MGMDMIIRRIVLQNHKIAQLFERGHRRFLGVLQLFKFDRLCFLSLEKEDSDQLPSLLKGNTME